MSTFFFLNKTEKMLETSEIKGQILKDSRTLKFYKLVVIHCIQITEWDFLYINIVENKCLHR